MSVKWLHLLAKVMQIIVNSMALQYLAPVCSMGLSGNLQKILCEL